MCKFHGSIYMDFSGVIFTQCVVVKMSDGQIYTIGEKIKYAA